MAAGTTEAPGAMVAIEGAATRVAGRLGTAAVEEAMVVDSDLEVAAMVVEMQAE